MNTIFLYAGDECTNPKQLQTDLESFDVTCIWLKDDDLCNTLDEIIHKKPHTNQTRHFPFGVMIFHDLPKEKFNEIFKQLKEKDYNIKRKAMVTETNKTWTLYDLFIELDQEHQYYAKYDELKQLLIENSKRKKEDYTHDSWIPYQYAYLAMYQIYEEKKLNTEELSFLIEQFQLTIQRLIRT